MAFDAYQASRSLKSRQGSQSRKSDAQRKYEKAVAAGVDPEQASLAFNYVPEGQTRIVTIQGKEGVGVNVTRGGPGQATTRETLNRQQSVERLGADYAIPTDDQGRSRFDQIVGENRNPVDPRFRNLPAGWSIRQQPTVLQRAASASSSQNLFPATGFGGSAGFVPPSNTLASSPVIQRFDPTTLPPGQSAISQARKPTNFNEFVRSRAAVLNRNIQNLRAGREPVSEAFASSLQVTLDPSVSGPPGRLSRRAAENQAAALIGAGSVGASATLGRSVITTQASSRLSPEALLLGADAIRRANEVGLRRERGSSLGSAVGDEAILLGRDVVGFSGGNRLVRSTVPGVQTGLSGVTVRSTRLSNAPESRISALDPNVQVRDVTLTRTGTFQRDVLGNTVGRQFDTLAVRDPLTGRTRILEYEPGRPITSRQANIEQAVVAQDRTTGFRDIRIATRENRGLFYQDTALTATARGRTPNQLFLRNVRTETRITPRTEEAFIENVVLPRAESQLRTTGIVRSNPALEAPLRTELQGFRPSLEAPEITPQVRTGLNTGSPLTGVIRGQTSSSQETVTVPVRPQQPSFRPISVSEPTVLVPSIRELDDDRTGFFGLTSSRTGSNTRGRSGTSSTPSFRPPSDVQIPRQPVVQVPNIRVPQRQVPPPAPPPTIITGGGRFPPVPPRIPFLDLDFRFPRGNPNRRLGSDRVRVFESQPRNIPSLTALVGDLTRVKKIEKKKRFTGVEIRGL